MTRHRRIGVLFGLLAFVAIAAAALLIGLPSVEDKLEDDTTELLADLGVREAIVEADGQDLSVRLPRGLPAGQTVASLTQAIRAEDGVRTLTLDVDIPAVDVSIDPPEPTPTLEPVPTPEAPPTPEPTPTVPPTAAPVVTPVPDPEPTATPQPDPTATPEPEPTATPEPEPTAIPEPTATPEPQVSASEVVAGLDLGNIQFQDQTANFAPGTTAALDAIAAALIELDGVPIEVQAHTDSTGDPDFNLLLSQERAEAVASYLVSQGVDAASLTARGFGASSPIADNGTEQGQAANRRVELVVVEGN